MNCAAVVNIEDLYAEGRLSPSRKAQVQSHIKDCPACAVKVKASDPLAGTRGPAAPKDLKERMKKLLAKIEVREPEAAAQALSMDSEMWPVVASIAIYLGLALTLAWAGPGVPSQKYEGGTVTEGNGYGSAVRPTPIDKGGKP